MLRPELREIVLCLAPRSITFKKTAYALHATYKKNVHRHGRGARALVQSRRHPQHEQLQCRGPWLAVTGKIQQNSVNFRRTARGSCGTLVLAGRKALRDDCVRSALARSCRGSARQASGRGALPWTDDSDAKYPKSQEI